MMTVGIPVPKRRHPPARRIEDDTILVPQWVAESVINEASAFVGQAFPEHFAGWLAQKAAVCYAGNARFHRLLQGRGNGGREWLRVFMRHWLAGLLRRERPDLFVLFPQEWTLGRRVAGVASGRPLMNIGFQPGTHRWRERGCGNPLLSGARFRPAQS